MPENVFELCPMVWLCLKMKGLQVTRVICVVFCPMSEIWLIMREGILSARAGPVTGPGRGQGRGRAQDQEQGRARAGSSPWQ